MDQQSALAVVEQYLYAADRDVAHEIYHADAVLEFPQSGERFEGVENFKPWRKRYPAQVEFQLTRLRGRDDLWIAEVLSRYDAGPWNFGVTILEFRGDKVAHETIYGGERWEAPEWRARWRARELTSHERRAGRPWDASYVDGPPPWDTGEPQPAIVRLAAEGAFAGAVLDAGCGTGDNALHIASLGLHVVGVDVAETALSSARAKAAERGLDAEFVLADALHLDRLGRVFETVLDCGLLHTFDRDERRDYVASLASVTGRGGQLHVLCFSDVGPDACGPHPISEEELRAAFTPSGGWSVVSVGPERLRTTFAAQGVPAWLARIERIR